MIFIDETTFGHSWKTPKVWSLKGGCKYIQKLELKYQMTIIGAVGEGGFICYQIVQGIVNSEIFTVFLDQLLIQCQKFYKEIPYVLIMDNCQIHKSKLVQQIYAQRMKTLFLPPYCPALNPIELVWAKIKRSIRCEEIRTTTRLIQLIQKNLNNLNESFIQKVINTQFRHLLKYLEKIEYNI